MPQPHLRSPVARVAAIAGRRGPQRRRLALVAATLGGLGLAAGLGACGTSMSDASGMGATALDPGAFCAPYAAAVCGVERTCHCFDESALGLCEAMGLQSCLANVGIPCALHQRSFAPDQAQACLAQLANSAPNCDLEGQPWPESCSQVTHGVVAQDGVCSVAADCVQGLECPDGRCVALPGQDQPCDALGRCAAGLLCVQASTPTETDGGTYDGIGGAPPSVTGVCLAPGGAGAPCLENANCLSELYCPSPSVTESQCAPRLGAGSPCSAYEDSCQADLVCVPDAGGSNYVCTSKPGPGELCTSSQGGAQPCRADCYCPTQPVACAPLPTSGQACPNGLCVSTAYCDPTDSSAVCRDRVAENEACSAGAMQRLMPCSSGLQCKPAAAPTCRELLPDGSPCMDSIQCLAGSYCSADRLCAPRLGAGGDCMFDPTGCAADFYCDVYAFTCTERLGQGGDCMVSPYACAADMFCSGPAMTCQPRIPAGQGCTPPFDECATDAYCDGSQCLALPGAGSPCAPGSMCLAGSYCLGPNCQALPGLNESCQGSNQCAGAYCAAFTCQTAVAADPCSTAEECSTSLYCDFGLSQCAPRLALGKTCTTSSECQADLYCGAANTCVTRPADGAACSDADACAVGQTCSTGGTCTPPPSAGSPCTPWSVCASSAFCASICTALGDYKAPCSSADQCLSGACSGGICAARQPLVCAGPPSP